LRRATQRRRSSFDFVTTRTDNRFNFDSLPAPTEIWAAGMTF